MYVRFILIYLKKARTDQLHSSIILIQIEAKHEYPMLEKVSCLNCTFLFKELENLDYVYRCQAHALREVKVSNQILCTKFLKKEDKRPITENKNIDANKYDNNYFDSESLYKVMHGSKRDNKN